VKFLPDRLRANARSTPDHPAILTRQETLTFAELEARSRIVAAALQRGGLQRGDRVALFAGNSAGFVVAFFAVLEAGGAAVPISPLTKAPKLATLLRDCGVQAVVAGAAVALVLGAVVGDVPTLGQVLWIDEPPAGAPAGRTLDAIVADGAGAMPPPALTPRDLAAVIYTSGTTSTPKGVMLTHGNLANTTTVIADYLGNRVDDVVMCALPLAHTYGLVQVLVGASVGHAVALEASFAYPFDVLRRMQDLRVTGFPGVPALYGSILQLEGIGELDLSSLRYLTNAAGPLPPAQVQRLRRVFPHARLFPMYGLTECTRVCFLAPELVDGKIGSVGKAIANCEVFVVDERGHVLGPGEVGELVVRGANVMPGYWNRPEETAKAFVPIDAPGGPALRSGDLFRTDAEGFLYFVGRRDDVFKCKGEKVSPAEVEKVLIQLPGVAEAGVVGLPSARGELEVVAAIVTRQGAALDEVELRRHCRANLENYAQPVRFVYRSGLPKTESGKLDRRGLCAELAAGQRAATSGVEAGGSPAGPKATQ
jgi:amino acid adenylation domain-containing protein